MSSAKAALESDTRVLAWEAGRKWGVRVNTISAGPLGSRAAKAIGFIDDMIRYSYANAPVQKELEAREVGAVAAFLLSPLASAVSVFFFFFPFLSSFLVQQKKTRGEKKSHSLSFLFSVIKKRTPGHRRVHLRRQRPQRHGPGGRLPVPGEGRAGAGRDQGGRQGRRVTRRIKRT